MKSKKKKGGRGIEEDDDLPQELLHKPKEYAVRFIFPNPPPLNPPILGAYGISIIIIISHLFIIFIFRGIFLLSWSAELV